MIETLKSLGPTQRILTKISSAFDALGLDILPEDYFEFIEQIKDSGAGRSIVRSLGSVLSDLRIFDPIIDGLDVVDETTVLMSFRDPAFLPGFGLVDDSDIVQFNASQLGQTTRGTFEMFFDGSDYGLTKGAEDIDAFHYDHRSGFLSISTVGDAETSSGQTFDQNDQLRIWVGPSIGVRQDQIPFWNDSVIDVFPGQEDSPSISFDEFVDLLINRSGGSIEPRVFEVQGDFNLDALFRANLNRSAPDLGSTSRNAQIQDRTFANEDVIEFYFSQTNTTVSHLGSSLFDMNASGFSGNLTGLDFDNNPFFLV